MANIIQMYPRAGRAAEPPLPPLGTQLLNAGKAVLRNAAQVAAGGPLLVPVEVEAARWEQCRTCTHFRPSDQRCGLCGCYTKAWLVDKVRLAAEACLDKPPRWGAWQPATGR